MYLVNITTSTAVSQNANIIFNSVAQTNKRVSYSNGVFTFNKPGFYEIRGMLNCTGIAQGNISANIMSGTQAIADAQVGATSTGTTDVITLPIVKTINIKSTDEDEFATISIQLSTAATITDANLAIQYVR